MTDTIKAVMDLTTETCKQADLLSQRFGGVNGARVVSNSLQIAAVYSDLIEDGAEPLVMLANGELMKMVIPGLAR